MSGTRLVLSQGTFLDLPAREFLDVCAESGLSAGLWRACYADVGAAKTRELADERDVELVSLCRVGFFTQPDPAGIQNADNLAGLDEAVTLGIDTVVVVVGQLVTSFAKTEQRIRSGLEQLLPHAIDRGLKLAIEPFHPMMAAERSAIVQLGHALDVVESFDSDALGVALDSYHVWWDRDLAAQIERSAPHLMSVHLSDWIVPTPNILRGRGIPGEGVIDLTHFMELVRSTGYDGRIEIEVLSNDRRLLDSPLDTARRLRAATEHLLNANTAQESEPTS